MSFRIPLSLRMLMSLRPVGRSQLLPMALTSRRGLISAPSVRTLPSGTWRSHFFLFISGEGRRVRGTGRTSKLASQRGSASENRPRPVAAAEQAPQNGDAPTRRQTYSAQNGRAIRSVISVRFRAEDQPSLAQPRRPRRESRRRFRPGGGVSGLEAIDEDATLDDGQKLIHRHVTQGLDESIRPPDGDL